MVTHIDNDHIAGLRKVLLAAPELAVDQIWFNGLRHLPAPPLERHGPAEGDRLSTLITERSLRWNTAFGGGAVAVGPGPAPATVTLSGGLALTVLSPGVEQLVALRRRWRPVVVAGGLDPAEPLVEEPVQPPRRLERQGEVDVAGLARRRTQPDHSEANGSSIALLAQWAGRSVLLAADAHAEVLLDTLDRWLGSNGSLDVDVFKLPHHGSKANVTEDLMRRVRAQVYVFSSSGEGRSQHPNDEAVARVIEFSSGERTLAFNYRNVHTELWDEKALRDRHGYRTCYPPAGAPGLSIDLMPLPPTRCGAADQSGSVVVNGP